MILSINHGRHCTYFDVFAISGLAGTIATVHGKFRVMIYEDSFIPYADAGSAYGISEDYWSESPAIELEHFSSLDRAAYALCQHLELGSAFENKTFVDCLVSGIVTDVENTFVCTKASSANVIGWLTGVAKADLSFALSKELKATAEGYELEGDSSNAAKAYDEAAAVDILRDEFADDLEERLGALA